MVLQRLLWALKVVKGCPGTEWSPVKRTGGFIWSVKNSRCFSRKGKHSQLGCMAAIKTSDLRHLRGFQAPIRQTEKAAAVCSLSTATGDIAPNLSPGQRRRKVTTVQLTLQSWCFRSDIVHPILMSTALLTWGRAAVAADMSRCDSPTVQIFGYSPVKSLAEPLEHMPDFKRRVGEQ